MPLAIDGVQVHGAEAIGQVLALQQAAVHGRLGVRLRQRRAAGQGRRQGEAQGGDEQEVLIRLSRYGSERRGQAGIEGPSGLVVGRRAGPVDADHALGIAGAEQALVEQVVDAGAEAQVLLNR